jgi:hypothetical protein
MTGSVDPCHRLAEREPFRGPSPLVPPLKAARGLCHRWTPVASRAEALCYIGADCPTWFANRLGHQQPNGHGPL